MKPEVEITVHLDEYAAHKIESAERLPVLGGRGLRERASTGDGNDTDDFS